jgi:hypothetical protein
MSLRFAPYVAGGYIPPSSGVPGAPASVVAVAGNTSATVTFNTPASGGSPITLYTVTSSPGNITASGATNSIAYAPGTLTNGQAYTFTVTATNAIGTGPASAPSNSVTPNSGVGPPSAPTNLQLILAGQNSADNTPSPPTPTNPNRLDISWTAAVAGGLPLNNYKIYRSVNRGVFSFYAAPAGLGTTYSDTAATLSTNGTAGSTAPYYTANTYQYKVSAVDTGGNESAQSGPQIFVIYKNGTRGWNLDYAFGGSPNYSDTTGSPQGGVADVLFTNSGFGGMLPVSSHWVTQWNMWVGGYRYLSFDLKPTNAAFAFQLYALRVGDVKIYNSSGVSYNVNPGSISYGAVPVNGVWGTHKVPVADFLTDWGPSGAGPAVVQNALYKFAIQNNVASNGNFYVDNIILSDT